MKANTLRTIRRTRPFRPFTIRAVDGNEYKVVNPECLAIAKNGRVAVLFTPEDEMEIIKTASIASIHEGNGKKRQPRGR